REGLPHEHKREERESCCDEIDPANDPYRGEDEQDDRDEEQDALDGRIHLGEREHHMAFMRLLPVPCEPGVDGLPPLAGEVVPPRDVNLRRAPYAFALVLPTRPGGAQPGT